MPSSTSAAIALARVTAATTGLEHLARGLWAFYPAHERFSCCSPAPVPASSEELCGAVLTRARAAEERLSEAARAEESSGVILRAALAGGGVAWGLEAVMWVATARWCAHRIRRPHWRSPETTDGSSDEEQLQAARQAARYAR